MSSPPINTSLPKQSPVAPDSHRDSSADDSLHLSDIASRSISDASPKAVLSLKLENLSAERSPRKVSPKILVKIFDLNEKGMTTGYHSPRGTGDALEAAKSSSSDDEDSSTTSSSVSAAEEQAKKSAAKPAVTIPGLNLKRVDANKSAERSVSFRDYLQSSDCSTSTHRSSDASSPRRRYKVMKGKSKSKRKNSQKENWASSSSQGRQRSGSYSPHTPLSARLGRSHGSSGLIELKQSTPREMAFRRSELEVQVRSLLNKAAVDGSVNLGDSLKEMRSRLDSSWEKQSLDQVIAETGCPGIYLRYFERHALPPHTIVTMVDTLLLKSADQKDLVTNLQMLRSRLVPPYLHEDFDNAVARSARPEVLLVWPHACQRIAKSFYATYIQACCDKWGDRPKQAAVSLIDFRQALGREWIAKLKEGLATADSDKKEQLQAEVDEAEARFKRIRRELDGEMLNSGYWYVTTWYFCQLEAERIHVNISVEEMAKLLLRRAKEHNEQSLLVRSSLLAYVEHSSASSSMTLLREDNRLASLLLRNYAVETWSDYVKQMSKRVAGWFPNKSRSCKPFWINPTHMDICSEHKTDRLEVIVKHSSSFVDQVEKKFNRFCKKSLQEAPETLRLFLRNLAELVHAKFDGQGRIIASNFLILRMLGHVWHQRLAECGGTTPRASVLHSVQEVLGKLSTGERCILQEELSTASTSSSSSAITSEHLAIMREKVAIDNAYKQTINQVCDRLQGRFDAFIDQLIS